MFLWSHPVLLECLFIGSDGRGRASYCEAGRGDGLIMLEVKHLFLHLRLHHFFLYICAPLKGAPTTLSGSLLSQRTVLLLLLLRRLFYFLFLLFSFFLPWLATNGCVQGDVDKGKDLTTSFLSTSRLLVLIQFHLT